MNLRVFCNTVIFCDGRQFSLDEPHVFPFYWHGLRKTKEWCLRRRLVVALSRFGVPFVRSDRSISPYLMVIEVQRIVGTPADRTVSAEFKFPLTSQEHCSLRLSSAFATAARRGRMLHPCQRRTMIKYYSHNWLCAMHVSCVLQEASTSTAGHVTQVSVMPILGLPGGMPAIAEFSISESFPYTFGPEQLSCAQ